jgi:photosystem II stability/assembly factor-like uncharacterized protein
MRSNYVFWPTQSGPIPAFGWRLLFFCIWLMILGPAFAQTWTNTGAPTMTWFSVATSADGTKLIAASASNPLGDYGSVYTSSNGGAVWTQTLAPSNVWASVASSADGNNLIATPSLGAVCLSTDGGNNWSSNNCPSDAWHCVATSADGTKLVAVGHTFDADDDDDTSDQIGVVYTSADAGNTWVSNSLPVTVFLWYSVASSADGNTLAVVSQDGQICVSTNAGETWQQPVNGPSTNNIYDSVACSANGRKLVVVSQYENPAYTGSIYTSTNSGLTWTSNNVPSLLWESVASSADGNRLFAVGYNFPSGSVVYFSTNAGTSWTHMSTGNYPNFASGIITPDGYRMFAINGGGISGTSGNVYTASFIPSPILKLTASSGTLKLRWTVPSTNFVLQQKLNLIAASWVTLTNLPTLNLTNLQDQVVLSPTNTSAFYRLSTP